ncbi:MAG: tRNA preQ1(34) S-adenosylmethionine ribosyltransferase-isomerase QueA [Oligoflexia bacterium]|nr:tRNA preQ1(34) S-adenosylmethionine ribosyltransferase-isomerase QueA [Oligoflexia bacterium]
MTLKTNQLSFNYPNELVALKPKPRGESRIFIIPKNSKNFKEISWLDFYKLFKPKDLLILNNTKVLKARLIMGNKEVFYLKSLQSSQHWQVLTKNMKLKLKKIIDLPGGVKAEVLKTGKVSEIQILNQIDVTEYLNQFGHVPLPPYILQLRESHNDNPEDIERYQTLWAKEMGSVAAPTASLHFGNEQLEQIKNQGVDIDYITLHVGAGTFLPIDVENVDDFKIHSESFFISPEVKDKIKKTKEGGGRVWACGTTVVRALESWASGAKAEAELFIKPGYKFRVIDTLLTNFHQPESSLLLLAAAFCGQNFTCDQEAVDKIINAYNQAVEAQFRLFSYGDLTVMV